MADRVVGGEVADAGSHERTAGPHLLVERTGFGLDSRVGDQPGLQVAPSAPIEAAADEAVQRQPVQPLLQFDRHGQTSTSTRSANP